MEQSVLLADNNNVGYLVDLNIEHLLRTKRVWTKDDGTLMVRVCFIHKEEQEEMHVAQFVWETIMMQGLGPKEALRFKNGTQRDCRFTNLEVVPKHQERSA